MAQDSERDYATPTLMRAARGVYARSIRVQLEAIGAEELPRGAAFVLTAIASEGRAPGTRRTMVGVSKPATSRAVSYLVDRGYVEHADAGGQAFTLTQRGREVLEAVVQGCDSVDEALLERASPEKVEAMRECLKALAQMKISHPDGRDRSRSTGTGQLRQFSPIFKVRDLAATLAHYESLGFETFAYEDGEDYGFADRDGVGLHFASVHGEDPGGGQAYLYVSDADALYEAWSAAGIGGHTMPVNPTPYRLREGAHRDPDGNLIRFGSPMED